MFLLKSNWEVYDGVLLSSEKWASITTVSVFLSGISEMQLQIRLDIKDHSTLGLGDEIIVPLHIVMGRRKLLPDMVRVFINFETEIYLSTLWNQI